jgi:nitrogen regulatory protein P-II 1
MKEIKAFVHQHRMADVIEAIKTTKAWTAHSGGVEPHHLAVTAVQGTLRPVDDAERHYSVELGLEVVREFKIELHCDEDCVDELVQAIVTSGRTGQHCAGWVYVVDISTAHPIR